MATMTPERTRVEEPSTTVTSGSERRRTGFVVLAIVVALALGFGLGWAIFRDTGTDVPDGIEALLDDYTDAWNEPNGDAAVALMTPGARFYSSAFMSAEGLAGDDLIDHINGFGPNGITVDGEITVVGDGPYTVVSERSPVGYDGFSVVFVREVDGELLIAGHHWYRN